MTIQEATKCRLCDKRMQRGGYAATELCERCYDACGNENSHQDNQGHWNNETGEIDPFTKIDNCPLCGTDSQSPKTPKYEAAKGICRKPVAEPTAIALTSLCVNCGGALRESFIRKSGWEHVK